jgi:hypothetical protein
MSRGPRLSIVLALFNAVSGLAKSLSYRLHGVAHLSRSRNETV